MTQIELFLQKVGFELDPTPKPSFTFSGLVLDLEMAQSIMDAIPMNPLDCKLKFFIELPEE